VALMLVPGMLLSAKTGLTKVDARLLVDISGSMKKNDPQQLRRSALRLLVDLMPNDNRAGVWTFGQYIKEHVPLGKIDESWKKRARKQANQFHSNGLFTDIEEVLRRGISDWKKPEKGYRRDVVLLTDGKVDISKDQARNEASRQRILLEILPKLKEVGARVHIIALSRRVDHALLRKLSDETDGGYEWVRNEGQLKRFLQRVFENISRPKAVPMKANGFKIDATVKEVTLLVFSRTDKPKPVRVITPRGKGFGIEDAPESVSWHQSQGYDLLTISKPAVGEWGVKANIDPDHKMVVITDLKMHTLELPKRVAYGEQFPFIVQFSNKGKKITREAFLRMIEVKGEYQIKGVVSDPYLVRDDGLGNDQIAWDGNFNAVFGKTLGSGHSVLTITADGKTFKRERRQTFEIRNPLKVSIIKRRQEGLKGVEIVLIPDLDVVSKGSLSPFAWLEGTDGSRAGVLLAPDGMGSWRAWVDTSTLIGNHQLWINLSATSQMNNPVQLELGFGTIYGTASRSQLAKRPVTKKSVAENKGEMEITSPTDVHEDEGTDESVDEEGSDWVTTVIFFGLINLVVFGAGVGGYLLYRRRKGDGLVQLIDDEYAESEEDEG